MATTNNGGLIFPIGFDLESGVKQAEQTLGRSLSTIEKFLASHPVKLHVEVDKNAFGHFEAGANSTIAAIERRMSKLAEYWNRQLANNLKFDGKNLSAQPFDFVKSIDMAGNKTFERLSPKQIMDEYKQLFAALKSNGRTLGEYANSQLKSAEAMERSIKKAMELKSLLTEQGHSYDGLSARIKLYENSLNKIDPSHKAFGVLTQKIRELKTELGQLKKSQELAMKPDDAAYRTWLANRAKEEKNANQQKIEDARRTAAEIKRIQEESQVTGSKVNTHKLADTMEYTQRKWQELNAELNAAMQRRLVIKAEIDKSFAPQLKQLQDEINRVYQKIQAAEKRGVDTEPMRHRLNKLFGDLNALRQQKIQLFDTDAIHGEIERIKKDVDGMTLRMGQAQEAFGKGLDFNDAADKRITKIKNLRSEIANLENEFKRMQTSGEAYDKGGNLTPKANSNLRQQVALMRELEKVSAGTSAELAKVRQSMEAWEKMRSTVASTSTAINALNAKLQIYQQKLNEIQALDAKGDVSAKYARMALEVRRITEELQRATQVAQDFQQKAFQGLDNAWTTKQVQQLTQLREQLKAVDQEYNRLHQSGGAQNADGSFTQKGNQLLQQRVEITTQINNMLKTAADAQLERERQITEEKRKQGQIAREQAEKAKREQKQTQSTGKLAEREKLKNLLARQTKDIDTITRKLEYYRSLLNRINPQGHGKAFTEIAQRVRDLTRELESAQKNVDALTNKTEKGAQAQANGHKKVNGMLSAQHNMLVRILQRLAIYASINQLMNFVSKIRDVTAEFEKQRVSLGAILQSRDKADEIFSQLKGLAVKSPVSLLDLTKYTKQLAAYKIGYEDLFETTKRLTDVSVGLGVSMDRIILMYGQIRATGYLRASEVRQATEAGIPLVEELAKKLTLVNGELVRAADVMDMISKREIPFELVKQVFEDMTAQGGIFYDMQRKQADTLYGMWAKLGDVVSIAINEMGNTKPVNSTMKSVIGALSSMATNWEQTMRIAVSSLTGAGIAMLALKVHTIGTKAVTDKLAVANNNLKSANVAVANAERALETATRRGSSAEIQAAQAALTRAKAEQQKAAALRSSAMAESQSTKATMVSGLRGLANGARGGLAGLISAIIGMGIGFILDRIANLVWKTNKLKDELKNIKADFESNTANSIADFRRLAGKAVDGDVRALEELRNKYGEILPLQDLTIERLQAMSGGYTDLENAIRSHNAALAAQRAMEAALDTNSSEIKNKRKEFITWLKNHRRTVQGSHDDVFSDDFLESLLNKVEDKLTNTRMGSGEAMKRSLVEMLGGKPSDYTDWVEAMSDSRAWNSLVKKLKERREAIEDARSEFDEIAGALGQYAQSFRSMEARIRDFDDGTATPGSALFQRKKDNFAVLQMLGVLRTALGDDFHVDQYATRIGEITDAMQDISSINFDEILEHSAELTPVQKALIQQVQRKYLAIAPTSRTAQNLNTKLREFTVSMDGNFDKMAKYMMKASERYEDYSKRIRDSIKSLGETIDEYNRVNFITPNTYSVEEIAALQSQQNILNAMLAFLAPESGSGHSGDDPRIGMLQEIIQLAENMSSSYRDLKKAMGDIDAVANVSETYGEAVLAATEALRQKGIIIPGLNVPKTRAELARYIGEIRTIIRTLPKSDKVAIEIGTKMANINIEEEKQAIERQLKKLAESVARTRTAREFYNNILSQTGDVELAMRASVAIYGEDGHELFDRTIQQIREIFKSGDLEVDTLIETRLNGLIDVQNQRINYQQLAALYSEYQEQILENNRQTAEQIIANGQKAEAGNFTTWQKELFAARTFEEKRTAIIDRETQRRAAIMASHAYDGNEEARNAALAASSALQERELSDLRVKEFKESEYYVRMFQELGNKTTNSLVVLKSHLQEIIETERDMSPDNMRTMVEALERVDNTLKDRGFGTLAAEGLRKYFDALKRIREAEERLEAAEAERDANMPFLELELGRAEVEKISAQEEYDRLLNDENAAANDTLAARLRLNTALSNYEKTLERILRLEEGVEQASQEVDEAENDAKESANDFKDGLAKVADKASEIAGWLSEVNDLLGISKDSATGMVFDSAISGLEQMNKGMNLITAAQATFNVIAEANPWVAISAAIIAAVSIMGSLFSASKVRKANKIIEEQSKVLERLERQYARLEKAMERTFGGKYIDDHKKQLEILEAQIAAKQKQLAAEQSKGKKKSKDEIEGYKNDILDVQEEIADLYGTISEKFLGQDIAGAARDFAQAWLDAYAEFGNTCDAMSEKFHDMIQNMVVESLIGKVMERALKPMFEAIDGMGDADFYSEDFWRNIVDMAEKGAKDADYGARVAMEFLENAGISMRDLGGNLSGISREIASASEESINGLAAGINTQNYYIAQQLSEVQTIRALLEANGIIATSQSKSQGYADLVELQTQAMTHLAAIERNTAENVNECRAIASECADIANKLGRVIKAEGGKVAVNVRM